MNHAFKATAHENKIRRWQTFTPPQNTAHAAHCGLVLHWRAYNCFTVTNRWEKLKSRHGFPLYMLWARLQIEARFQLMRIGHGEWRGARPATVNRWLRMSSGLHKLAACDRLEGNQDCNDCQFEGTSPRSSRTASTSKSRASGTCANWDATEVKIDGGTCGL